MGGKVGWGAASFATCLYSKMRYFERDPISKLDKEVSRSDYYRQSYSPTKHYQDSHKYWPGQYQSMTQFLDKKRQTEAKEFIENQIATDPKSASKFLLTKNMKPPRIDDDYS